MKAFVIDRYKPRDGGRIADVPDPLSADRQVLVQVRPDFGGQFAANSLRGRSQLRIRGRAVLDPTDHCKPDMVEHAYCRGGPPR